MRQGRDGGGNGEVVVEGNEKELEEEEETKYDVEGRGEDDNKE